MHVVDSHTGGMPTRVILDGGPDLGSGSLARRAHRLASEHEAFFKSILLEPRGQPGMVGALLVEAETPDCEIGVIYFDADAVLGMCGHGTIGLAVTLAYLDRITPGTHKFETPAGVISVDLLDANTARVTNVESRRVQASVTVEVAGHGSVTGDLAYGGNWFFIVDPSPIPVVTENIRALTDLTIAIREACIAQGVTGENAENVDHVILQGVSGSENIHSRNFVLCPDNQYDRSPCGTGSSARLACLAASGVLGPGEEIVQESVIGSSYRLSYQPGRNGTVSPSLEGQAFVMAEGKLLFAREDPFRAGIFH